MSQRPQPGTRVRVRVQPKSSRNQVVGYRGDTLRLRVTASPEGGQANEAVVSMLAQVLDIAKSRIEIVRGHAACDKIVQDSVGMDGARGGAAAAGSRGKLA